MKWAAVVLGLLVAGVARSDRRLKKDSQAGTIPIDRRVLKEYSERKKDDWTLVLLATASDTPRCEFCTSCIHALEKAVGKLSREDALDVTVIDDKGRTVVFGVLDVLRYRDVLYLNDIPHVYILNHNNLKCPGSGFCKHTAQDILPRTESIDDAVLIKAVLHKLGRDDLWTKHFYKPPLITKQRLLGTLATVAVISLPLLPTITKVLIKHMWMVAVPALTIFWASTSGIIYNWQNNSWRLFGLDQYGNRVYIHPQARFQFLGEGMGLAFLNIAISFLLYFVAVAMNPKNKYRRVLLPLAVMSGMICFYLYFQVSGIVLRKAPYISYNLLPGNNYVRGSPRNDRHYTI
ncbi:OST3/OST6 family protein [Gregarina niphandrodes]|uniref:OST3/OST6 family protein n=1 Tax=Gregarina niphandrodes TaxID=110365 RepID=A0A023BB52_GRENI|nr:OST3/OST6 family protein [Gregarina niphandrodes]EZG79244.1 OST3/OST6 family protein [Gregarina niphandrodes]|eukprot:XP_011129091.1 OST3/OST6 family protein [Gregarina niphandrodes]